MSHNKMVDFYFPSIVVVHEIEKTFVEEKDVYDTLSIDWWFGGLFWFSFLMGVIVLVRGEIGRPFLRAPAQNPPGPSYGRARSDRFKNGRARSVRAFFQKCGRGGQPVFVDGRARSGKTFKIFCGRARSTRFFAPARFSEILENFTIV